MNYKIDKNIPRNDTRTIDFPFKDMEINDSFFIPEDDYKSMPTIRQTINNRLVSYKLGIKGDYKVSIKKVKGGLRVWRIK